MDNEITPDPDRRSFEERRQVNHHGAEYWSARGLQPLLGYSQWRRFEEAVQRAIERIGGTPPELLPPAEHSRWSAADERVGDGI